MYKKNLKFTIILFISIFTMISCSDDSTSSDLDLAITSINPNSGTAGTEVTLKGRNFTDESTVQFGDTEANITDQSESKIITTVPQGLTEGTEYDVIVMNGGGKVSARAPRPFKVTGADSSSDCNVTLYDGDNYTDDHIRLDGPAEYSSLEDLPGADKDWNDEADSFKSGAEATVTFWTKINFEGDSTTYDQGAEEPSVDEPSSLKIECK